MAAEEKRTITIKINGQEVAASIKLVEKELAKARIELKNSEIGSAKYVASMKRVGELSPVLNKHRSDLKAVSTEGGMMKGVFSGAGSAILGMLGPLALLGVALSGFRSAIQTSTEFETAMKQLEVRTGITGESLKALATGANELGVAYGTAPKAIALAFGEAASTRPELIKNTEALKDFTKQALILSKITGEEVGTSISNLSTIMNTNGILTSETAETVNMLVGAAQLGAKEIPFLSQAMEKIGGTAANANVSLSEQASVIEVLGEKYTSSAETAGTNVRNILITLQKEWAKSNDGPFNFGQSLDQLGPKVNDITALTEIFGKENVVAAQTILQNRDRIEELKLGIEGYAGAQDLANNAQSTLSGQLDIMSAKWSSLWSSMSDGGGILTALVGGTNMLIDSIGKAWDNLQRFAGNTAQLQEDAENNRLAKEKGRSDKAQRVIDQFTKANSTGQLVTDYDAINSKLKELEEQNKSLNKESEKYKNDVALIAQIQRAIVDRKAQEVEAQKKVTESAAANAKQSADESNKRAAEHRARQARIDEESKRKDQALARELAAEKEILKIRNAAAAELNISNDVVQSGTTKIDSKPTQELQAGGGIPTQVLKAQEIAKMEVDIEAEKNQAILEMGFDTYDTLGSYAYDLANVGLQNRTNREIDALEDKKKRGLITEAAYQRERENIERAAFAKKKRLDTIQAGINGAVAVTKTFAQHGYPAGIVPAGFVTAETIAQIAVIRAQKYEDGGLVKGARHRDGGVPAELEDGEFVMSRRGVNPYTLPILKAMNKGLTPIVNFSNRAQSIEIERSESRNGTSDSASGGVDMSALVAEFRNIRRDMYNWTNELVVKNVKEDEDRFDNRLKSVKKVAEI